MSVARLTRGEQGYSPALPRVPLRARARAHPFLLDFRVRIDNMLAMRKLQEARESVDSKPETLPTICCGCMFAGDCQTNCKQLWLRNLKNGVK